MQPCTERKLTRKEAYSQTILSKHKRNYRNGYILGKWRILCCFPVFCKQCEAWHVFSKASQLASFPTTPEMMQMDEERRNQSRIRRGAIALMRHNFRVAAFGDAKSSSEEVYFKRKRIEHHAMLSLLGHWDDF